MGQACGCTSFSLGPNDIVLPMTPRGTCGCGVPSFEISHQEEKNGNYFQKLLSTVSSEDINTKFTIVNQVITKHWRNPYITLCTGFLLGAITFFVLVSNSLWRPIIAPNVDVDEDESSFIWMLLTSTAVLIQIICWIPFLILWCKNKSTVKQVVEDSFSDWIDRGLITKVLYYGGSRGSKYQPAQPAMIILYMITTPSNNIEMANATTTTVVRSAVVVPAVKEDEPKVKLKKLKEMFEEQLITAEDYEIKKQQIINSM